MGGKYFHLNFTNRDGLLSVHISDQSEGQEDTEWEGDNRERWGVMGEGGKA